MRMPPSHVCALNPRRGQLPLVVCGVAPPLSLRKKDERVFLLPVCADLREHLADGEGVRPCEPGPPAAADHRRGIATDAQRPRASSTLTSQLTLCHSCSGLTL